MISNKYGGGRGLESCGPW